MEPRGGSESVSVVSDDWKEFLHLRSLSGGEEGGGRGEGEGRRKGLQIDSYACLKRFS